MHRKPIIVGIGELLWDELPQGRQAGGAPINFVYHASQLGARGYAISAVGQDQSGNDILHELDKNKISYVIERVPYPTGHVLVQLENGVPTYTIVENVAWDHIPLTPRAVKIVQKADAVCWGTLALRSSETHQTIQKLLTYTSPKALRFFDVNLREHFYDKHLINQLLVLSNMFKMNDDEIKVLREMFDLNGSDDDVCMALLKAYRLHYLIFTAGERYSVIYTANEISRIETPRVKTQDTVGAGDAFSGAFVYSILTGKTLRQAHEAAVRVSAFVCTRTGAWPMYEGENLCKK